MNDWIILRLRRAKGGLLLRYEDDDGTQSGEGFIPGILSAVGDRIRRNLSEMRKSAGWEEPTPLPIFLERSPMMSWSETEDIVRAILRDMRIGLGDIYLIRLIPGRAVERKTVFSVADAISLPFVIGWDGPAADRLLRKLRTRPWVVNQIAAGGLEIVELGSKFCPDPHILISSVPDPAPSSAKLIIRLGHRDGLADEELSKLVPGQSLLVLEDVGWGVGSAFLKELVYGVIHDKPLHAALHSALQTVPRIAALYSDPAANHALRLSDTFVGLFEKAKRLDDLLAFDHDVAANFTLDEDVVPEIVWDPQGEDAFDRVRFVNALQKSVQKITSHVAADFNRETGAFVPMTRTARDLAAIEHSVEHVAHRLEFASRVNEKIRVLLHPREQRFFDIALMRRELRGSDTLFVGKRTAVMALRRYVVRAQIGRPLAQSIVDRHGPNVDSQLPPPPPGGHLLSVVLYPFDFECKSATVQSLRLPEHGPSEPVYFEVIAPGRHGPAEMRVSLYYELPPGAEETETHRNHLLQSFLILTNVAQHEMAHDTDVTVARLEVARRPAFDDLGSLGGRIASIGMNASPLKPDEHRFTMKGSDEESDVASWVSIPEHTIQAAIDDIRKLLRESTRPADDADPRFPKDYGESEKAARKAEFDSVIRKMAVAGNTLYRRVWRNRPGTSDQENKKHQQVLVEIRGRSDRTIQIMRYDLNYVFPWALLYDFLLPTSPSAAPVCDGFLRPVDGRPITCAECLNDCQHNKGANAICVWGFWGLRHEVEQLLHGEAASVPNVIKPLRDGGVLISVGFESKYFDTAVETLKGTFDATIRMLGDGDEAADILWSDSDRPAIAVFLGHHAPTEDGDWQLSLPGKRWLENRDLGNRFIERAGAWWQDPHTVILLAACGSAPADLEKLTTFVDTFAQAKASAVIGTEVVVFDGLAADLAASLVSSMLREEAQRATMGKAVLDFRRELLRQLSPLGFVITPYGEADIRLAVKENV